MVRVRDTVIVPWLSSWACRLRAPPRPGSERIWPDGAFTSVPAVRLSVADVAALLVSSIVALLVKPLEAVSVELYEAVPSTRSVEPAPVVSEPLMAHALTNSSSPLLSMPPVRSEAVMASLPPASRTTGALTVEEAMGTVVPVATVNVEGPARMLVVPSSRAMALESAAVRLSVELRSATVPAPPSVPPA